MRCPPCTALALGSSWHTLTPLAWSWCGLQPTITGEDHAGGEPGYRISSFPSLKPVRLQVWGHSVRPLRAGLACWRFNELCARPWAPWRSFEDSHLLEDPRALQSPLPLPFWHDSRWGPPPVSIPSWGWDLPLRRVCSTLPPSLLAQPLLVQTGN